jgi:glycosyltransferase involved in cell wall biosynthesis
MHILICNERFLFRFGLDRALIILGKGLKESGHTISIMANKYDRNVLEMFASNIIDVPETKNDYLNSNEFTEKWINNSWNNFFIDSNKPDIVVIGGWPFFSSIPIFKKWGIPVVFLDCGAVPLEGYTNGFLIIQKKLRELRKKYLKDATSIIAISDFIATTQSKADTDNKIPVCKILLGADHLDMKIWQMNNSNKKSTIINSFNEIKNKGKHCILNLGRWEPNCYKNSEALFDIMRKIQKKVPNTISIVLNEPSTIQIPHDLQGSIYPIGFPTDAELKYLMLNSNLGISTSRWEGFNLPLAEMQWLNKPVLVFSAGAHPEVVIHPWYLCRDNNEMAHKATELLNGFDLDKDERNIALKRFHDFFTWNRAIKELEKYLENIVQEENTMQIQNVLLIIDVTNASRDPANSGVIRITRRVCHELQKDLDPLFVIWDPDKMCYVFPTSAEYHQLSAFNGPVLIDQGRISPLNSKLELDIYLKSKNAEVKWLLLLETLFEANASNIRSYARKEGIKIAAVFHDAIPVLYPDLCKDPLIRDNHSNYMKGLAECNIIIPVSEFSANCLREFWQDNQITGCTIFPNLNPGEFGGFSRNQNVQEPCRDPIKILCVSTLEPRKNHKTLIRAFLLMQKEHPEINWTLTLVGNRYSGAFVIADEIQKISKINPRIQWLGVVSDDWLHRLYEESAFTVYPSIVEGFGIPILESIWHGKPVICSNNGVMSELAAEGGCLTTDILDKRTLADALYRLCTDRKLLIKLSRDAVNRPIKTWEEYTRQFLSILQIRDATHASFRASKSVLELKEYRKWEEILYPSCLCENWQMNHSERMALTTLLSRHIPYCSIEIGTYKGGSLSLISQFSKMAFSIDIDPMVPEKFCFFKNVTFLKGFSKVSLPLLLKSLDYEQVPVDFILIDGDHSAEGVRNDLNLVLSYIPKKPLFLMMHDSFNPECRRGMLEADWNKCPYVQWVDLDFVPGRLIENGSTADGEMWGGLALAYLTPTIKDGQLIIDRSANTMHELIKNNSKKYDVKL